MSREYRNFSSTKHVSVSLYMSLQFLNSNQTQSDEVSDITCITSDNAGIDIVNLTRDTILNV
jgi:archaellin